MFVNDRIVFVELHKTGGTHIGTWLERLVGGEQIGKHNRVPPHLRDRFIIGSVRNPWDWYVSLWAYGCAGNGAVHHQTTGKLDVSYAFGQLGREMGRSRPRVIDSMRQCLHDVKKPVEEWRYVYGDVNDPERFRAWLRLALDPERRFDLGEGYGFSSISQWAGLMTYRYLKLFTTLDDLLYGKQGPCALETGRKVLIENWLPSYVVRNEHLETDLLAALEHAGFELDSQQKAKLLDGRRDKTNRSTRLDTHFYFDSASIEMVRRSDALIVERHDYYPPV